MEKITRESHFDSSNIQQPETPRDGAALSKEISGNGAAFTSDRSTTANPGIFEDSGAVPPAAGSLRGTAHASAARTPGVRHRTASSELKERYRAETQFLRQKLGSLEQIRLDLGLSQRKISELLLVDPASWHRWAKQDRAPSYIYKSLQWFLALRERNPEVASLHWLKTHSFERENLYLEERLEKLSKEIALLKMDAKSNENLKSGNGTVAMALIALGVAMGFALCYWLLKVTQ